MTDVIIPATDLNLDRGLPNGTEVVHNGVRYVITGEIHYSSEKPNADGIVEGPPEKVSYVLQSML